MNSQIIQTFLNLSGIAGIALLDGRNRPFFCGLDPSLNPNQQDALAQGIQQVVATTPTDCDPFMFRFTHQRVYLYKLGEGVVLLVIANDQLSLDDYGPAIHSLKAAISEELYSAISTLQQWADDALPLGTDRPAAASDQPIPSPGDAASAGSGVTHQQAVAALNHLSDAAAMVLGKTIVTHGWQSARPEGAWLQQLEVQKSAHFIFNGSADPVLTVEQQQQLQAWVQAFIGRCGRTFRNFQSTVVETSLTTEEKTILLNQSSG
jgi:hypothetical protein